MTFIFACCLFVGVNPAEAGLISREQEIEMGQQTAKQLEAQYGVSQDAALQERVNRIGQRLAKVCGRDDITFPSRCLTTMRSMPWPVPAALFMCIRD